MTGIDNADHITGVCIILSSHHRIVADIGDTVLMILDIVDNVKDATGENVKKGG